MATYTYKGTYIYGTSSGWFKLGNNNIKVNDTYLNTNTGHVYKCIKVETKTSGGKTVKTGRTQWQYVRTDIIAKPEACVCKLACPKRTTISGGSHNRYMQASWDHYDWPTNAKNGKRAESLEYQWNLDITGKDIYRVYATGDERLKSSTISLEWFKVGNTIYNRNSFYPVTSRKLWGVQFRVRYKNSKGVGPWATEYRQFTSPKKPTISAMSFNTENGRCSFTITTDPGNGYQERYDTKYSVKVYSTMSKKVIYNTTQTSKNTSITVTWDAVNYNQLGSGDYYEITVKAWARGYRGDSEAAERIGYVSRPNKPVITSVSVSSKDSSGRCTAKFNNKADKKHPIDGVRLQYLKDSEAKKAAEIPLNANWEDFEVRDNSTCQALAIPVETIASEDGLYTWLRVKAWSLYEAVLYRTSDPYKVTKLYTPAPEEGTAADDYIDILSVTPGEDGTSAIVKMGWNKNGTDDSTGTELTWAEDSDAWESTDPPSEFTFTWNKGRITHSGTTYRSSATVTIKNLEEGKKYYIKARRYREGTTTTYSKYSKTATVVTSETPSSVTATCSDYVASDKSLLVQWSFTGNGLQREWQVVAPTGAIIASQKNASGSAQISADRLKSFATGNVVTFTVRISTGSEFVESGACSVKIVEAPTVSVNLSENLNVQPLTFEVESSQLCDLIVVIYSQGITGQYPLGLLRQTAGDTVHSQIIVPDWSGDEENTATIELPPDLDFWDNCEYTLSVIAVDRETGLQSEEVLSKFTVVWEHKAADPFDAVTLTSVNEVDEEGVHHQAVQIELTPPQGSSETDVFDIYRMTGDRAVLIGESFPLTYTVMDEYAPFGEDMTMYYRIALRTADGDVNFSDIEYELIGSCIRLDWADGSLELPYNLSIADKYKKDFQLRTHMSGNTDGYWNKAVTRTASLRTDVIRISQQTEIALARKLARYTGPVFVRTPAGTAFEANVEVADMSADNKAVMTIALDASEIDLTQEFLLPPPHRMQDEEEE